ncbi:MAG: hypothetical protein KF819_07165 [Labilithrix sp.]|nr:hypothetical protein [Labilithrix sp.]
MSFKILGACALFALPLAGCSSGDDVIVMPRDGVTSQSLSCPRAPGENVCDRRFEVPDDEHADYVAALQTTYTFAGQARDVLRGVVDACEQILIDIDEAPDRSSPDLVARAKAACRVVGLRYHAWPAGTFTISASVPECARVEPPWCAPAASLTRCAAPAIAVSVADEAPEEAKVLGASFERNGGVFYALRVELEGAASLSGAMAGNVGALAGGDACIPGAIETATRATSELSAAVHAVSDALPGG